MSAVVLRDVFRVHSTPEGDAAALQGLTLEVAEAEVLAVLGPSGAGKTTLLRIVAGLDRPSSGSVTVFGTPLERAGGRALAAYRARDVGYVEQRYAGALDPDRTVVESVALRLDLNGDREATRRALELLERVGLGARTGARPGELSGGEQQRAALCAALAHGPRLLLADEPTGELDRAAADDVFALIRELAHEDGTTAVVVSHDRRAGEFADRAVRIRDGRVSEEQRDGAEHVVVGKGGWVRIPEPLLAGANVGDRANVRLADGAIVLTAPGGIGDRRPEPRTPASARAARGPAVEVRGVTKRYGERTVLDALDATADAGALTVVAGPSGSGKTTLLDVVAGLESPDAGRVVVAGTDVAALDRSGRARLRAERIGYVPQLPELVPFLSACENVALAHELGGGGADGALAALDAVGLSERAAQRVDRLSGGERLRVSIARALAGDRAALLADEPTSRLDETNARLIAALLARLAHERGIAVLVASHDPVVLEQADERIDLG